METKWYDSQLFSAIIGAVATVGVMIITNIINKKNRLETERKEVLILITQSNSKLFSIIYNASINKEKIDYINLRKEVSNCSIIWLLPKDIRCLFVELIEVHNLNSKEYEENKYKISSLCEKISNQLMKYGVDSIGIK